ncbi:MAG: mechanosensitive ion channel family protein [Halobacteriaceae archaeon]
MISLIVGPDNIQQLLSNIWSRLIIAILVIVVSYFVGRYVTTRLNYRLATRFRRPSIRRVISKTAHAAILLVGIILSAYILGLRLTDIAISVTVFTAVLGLILAPIIGSVISGLFILADQPYEIGDMIEIMDRNQRGYVEDITIRYTKIFTLENTFIVIPNSVMRNRDIINYSAEDERIRLGLEIMVTYESDIQTARSMIEAAATNVEDVIEGGPPIRIGSARYPAEPTCLIREYSDDGITLRLRYWAKNPYRLETVKSNVQNSIWTNIKETDDISIAYPHMHHIFDETSGTAEVSVANTDKKK